MDWLSAQDRNAVLLHYFERKGYRAIGAILGISDDTAQKRVTRALGKLRTILIRRGVTISAGLAVSVGSASLAGASAAGSAGFGTLLLEKVALIKLQLIAGSVAALLLTGGIAGFVYASHPSADRPGQFVTVDLSRVINGDFMASWTPDYGSNHLQQLGQGNRVLKSVPFDVRGVVQLQGAFWKRKNRALPERVEGIPVGTVGRRIQILHANSAFPDPMGTMVAMLVLHYTDGDEAQFPIQQGVHCLDWWNWPQNKDLRTMDPNTVVAWTGRNPPADHNHARLRLFKTAFTNPQPEKEIKTIDYVSAMAESAPFMVALTVEK